MSHPEETLRSGLALLGADAPSTVDLDRVRREGARGRRRRQLTVVTAALLGAGGVTAVAVVATSAAPRPTIAVGPPQPAPSPADLGRVDDYVATYLPATTVAPVRQDPLAFEAGRCAELAAQPVGFGCWSPPGCQPDRAVTGDSPCNVGLTLDLRRNGTDLAARRANEEQAHRVVSPVTVNGSPGFMAVLSGFFTEVYWSLPDGHVASARGANYLPAEVLRFADGLVNMPDPAASPAPDAPSAEPSPTPARPVVAATPAGGPPAVVELHLSQEGTEKAFTGDGWTLGITQGASGPGAASVDVTPTHGGGGSQAFVYSEVHTSATQASPLPIIGPDPAVASTFTSAGGTHVVVCGAVARGTIGVGVLDTNGVRGWARLLDAGPAFDTLFFVYETPQSAGINAVQSVGGTSAGEAFGPLPPAFPPR